MKNILLLILILSACQSATKNAAQQQEQRPEAPTYLPVVGDSAIYIGTTRDRELKIPEQEPGINSDTINVDTVYADTVIIKRISFGAVACSVRTHYFIENLPKDKFMKLGQTLYVADSFVFKEEFRTSLTEVRDIFYNDSLNVDVYEMRESYRHRHKENHTVFKGKKVVR